MPLLATYIIFHPIITAAKANTVVPTTLAAIMITQITLTVAKVNASVLVAAIKVVVLVVSVERGW